ncbi:MAG: hypothetical protein LPK85_14230, partial [Gammaproteobacteria bacterium]|nr:hypothetical protein [Gammaproteobacteria bacterium]
MSPEHLHLVPFAVLADTLAESAITHAVDLGGAVTLHVGTREGTPIVLIENPLGALNAVWYDNGA